MAAAALRLERRYSAAPLAMYRIHGGNHFHGKPLSRLQARKRRIDRNRLLLPFTTAFERLPVRDRIAAYRVEVEAAPKTTMTIYRMLLLVFRTPVSLPGRAALLCAFLRWLQPWGGK